MFPTILIAIIIVPIAYFIITSHDRKRLREWNAKYPVYAPDSHLNIFQIDISDIKYQCNKDDIGVVIFAVKPNDCVNETENIWSECNRSTFSVIRDDGKLLGTIPYKSQKKYIDWSKNRVCTGFGMIQYDDATNRLWCHLYIFSPDISNTYISREIQLYLSWISTTYNTELIPYRYKD